MVVDIYGSKEIFVNEYRNLLADRLLSQLDFNPGREIRNLELLKLRFDESMLHTCQVMLKDITDSKRINAHIQTTIEFSPENGIVDYFLFQVDFTAKPHHIQKIIGQTILIAFFFLVESFLLSSLILSSQFWPPFKSTHTLELPEDLKRVFDSYTKSYEAYKGNRTLCWRPSIGRVELEIEIGNKKLDLTVSPIHAVIINEFQKQSSWHLEDLGQKLQVPASVIRKKITYWQAQGLIEETTNDNFVLIENFDQQTGKNTGENKSTQKIKKHSSHRKLVNCRMFSDADRPTQHVQPHEVEDDENESAMASAKDQREEELQRFWSYIVGMLTNLDSMPLERIHQMLRMFASHGPGVEFSQEELKNFLQRKVREHALIFAAGVYQLPK